MRLLSPALVVAAATTISITTHAEAAAIVGGDLVVVRVGTGTAALGTSATAAYLDEYTTGGSVVQSIAVPTTGNSLLLTGNGTTEGILTPSLNGQSLVFAGYRSTEGGSTTSTTKAIGVLDLATGTLDTSVGVTDAGSNATRSATTVDGSSFYFATAGAVRYVSTPGNTATSTVIDARNSRQVLLAGNSVLYGSNGSTAVTAKVQSYGQSPTTTTTPSAVVTLTTADAVNGFAFADLDPNVAGPDTLYALSTAESLLRKFTFDGTAWTARGSVSSTANDISAVTTSNGVNLYTTSSSTILQLTDAGGAGANLSINSSRVIATAATNTAFRGIAFVPEPTTLAALGMVGGALIRRRRA